MKSPYIKTTPKSSKQQQREADMANRRRSPALCGNSVPRSVIRGESLTTPHLQNPNSHPFAAITDFLCCTFALKDNPPEISNFIKNLEQAIGVRFGSMTSTNKGLHGWEKSYKIGSTGAVFAIGGQRGRAYLQLCGDACSLVSNKGWQKLDNLMNSTYHGRITRWDGAADDLQGIHNLAWALHQYDIGGFSTGGNRPSISQVGDWHNKTDTKGRTLYIGNRKNGKLLRVYEKGKQLGDPSSQRVRWEIELRNKDRIIPWDVITNPGPYTAGAHKCMNWIHDKTDRIKTHKNTTKIVEEAMTGHARNAFGPHFNYLMQRYDDAEFVLNLVIRDGIPKRLALP